MKHLLVAGSVLLALAAGVTTVDAQTRPAMVRSVDEPARVPYFQVVAPICPFTNQCISTFPAVPAGKRLRVLAVNALFRGPASSAFMSLSRDFNNGRLSRC